MVNEPPSHTGAIAELHATVTELQETVRQLEAERRRLIRRRRRQLLLVGAMLSLVVHIALLMYLSGVYRGGGRHEGMYQLGRGQLEGQRDVPVGLGSILFFDHSGFRTVSPWWKRQRANALS